MDAVLNGIAAVIKSLPPYGQWVAGGLVGLALMVIVYARTTDLFVDRRVGSQTTAFQDRLLRAIEVLTASEEKLQARLDAAEAENVGLRSDMDTLRADLLLIRNQRRRVIELLRDLKEGRVTVDTVEAALAGDVA